MVKKSRTLFVKEYLFLLLKKPLSRISYLSKFNIKALRESNPRLIPKIRPSTPSSEISNGPYTCRENLRDKDCNEGRCFEIFSLRI